MIEIAALRKQVEEKDLELLQLTGQFLDLEEERDSLREEVETHLKDFMRMSYGIKSPDGKRFIQKGF